MVKSFLFYEPKEYKFHLIIKGCFLILFFLLITFLQSCGNSTPKTREEPYTVIEKQNVTLTYLIKDNEIYYQRIIGAVLLGENPKMKVYATVTNTSDYAGVFKFYAKLSSQGNTIDFETEEYIGAGATKVLVQEKEINPYSFETNVQVDKWGVIAPLKSVDVQVTKYRTVNVN
jgi:hypothetical protein